MSAFRSFMIYDNNRSFIFLFIRLGFEVTNQWKDCRKELENKLTEQYKDNKEPSLEFEMGSHYGQFKGLLDAKTKCYFVLLSSPEVKSEYQWQTLKQIKDHIQKISNYHKIKKDEIESKETQNIINILKQSEIQYNQEFGEVTHFKEPLQQQKESQIEVKVYNQQQKSDFQYHGLFASNQLLNHQSQIKIQGNQYYSSKDLNADTLVKIFRCFMMWDFNKQFFYMFIRRGFPIDKIWSAERNKLELELKAKHLDPNDPKAKPKEPPEYFDYKGDFGLFKVKYDKTAKCYFILLSRFKTKDEPQIKLLNTLYDNITSLPKYSTLKFDALESKKKQEIENIINEQESKLISSINQKFVDTKYIDTKLGGICSPDEQTKNSKIKSPPPGRKSEFASSSIRGTLLIQQPQSIIFNGQDRLIEDDEQQIPEFLEQGFVSERINLYTSKQMSASKYIKKQIERNQ